MKLAVSIVALLTITALGLPGRAAELFPFVLPWDDASASITDLSSWNERPAGKNGFVTVRDGHLFANGKRWRIFGVNLAFGGNFPTNADAEKVAARMAKFGINCVRFHHMDMQKAPGGIFAPDGKTLDLQQLERLDYFIAQLKAHGIYADLNLHVSRTYPDRPRAEKEGNSNYDKGVDNFDPAMIALQKDYARALLTHVNPHTGKSYADEPAVALIEINNENALFDEWRNGGLDRAAAPYRAEISRQWTRWIEERHGSDEGLRAAWAEGAREAGREMLRNGDFSNGLEAWFVEQHEGAAAKGSIVDHALRIDISQPGSERWHVQFFQSGLALKAGVSYSLSFRARASSPRSVTALASQADEPWKQFASKTVEVGTDWRDYTFALAVTSDDTNARVGITSLGLDPGWVEFSSFSLHTSAVDGSINRTSDGLVPAFTRDEVGLRTSAARDDWNRFLWSVEERYWSGMARFLREDLKCRSLIIGTQLGWSPFPIQEQLDVVDSHAYWQHPHFPNRSWDMNDWTVQPRSMAGLSGGGTIANLALQRVAGKPYLCTEYNHSAPNPYDAETFPLITAYAALQDWDGVFAFAYSHRANDWDRQSIAGFFDIDQHPTKMATLPASVALFRRGDVAPAKEARIAGIDLERAVSTVRDQGPRLAADQFGVQWQDAFQHRVSIHLGDGAAVEPGTDAQRIVSDTDQLAWDTEKKVVTINTARSKGVIGVGGKFTLDDLTIDVASPWAVVQATVMEGEDFAHARRTLITAAGAAENTGWKWRDADKTTVGNDWGGAPSLVEGIKATVQFPRRAGLRAWALDEKGQRREEIPMTDGMLLLDSKHRTLWYEVAAP